MSASQLITATPDMTDPAFDGIGAVNGGGATSVLLKDYAEPQRSQILDLVFAPKFGASVSTMLVEVPGDGNSTQGSMPSHMHARDDLDAFRGYTWWVLREAKARNPQLTLDAAAWSAPGWLGDGEFWSQDTADYYVQWARLLRDVHGLKLDALGCRNEKGVSFEFAAHLRLALDAAGFRHVRVHAFDNWPADKFDFVAELDAHPAALEAIDIIGAHVMHGDAEAPAPQWVQQWAAEAGKPIWNSEDHVYRDGFDCLIGIVRCFNRNFIVSGATKVVLWYDIAGVYPIEPYPTQPAMIIAREPWSGHYEIREALWAYAHYGQFTEAGWTYVRSACGELADGGSVVVLRSPEGADISAILETEGASRAQRLVLRLAGIADGTRMCVWSSDEDEQFVRRADLVIKDGAIELDAEPNTVYSISSTSGQRKGTFDAVPPSAPFPFPYYDDYSADSAPQGRLPHFTADIAGAFELTGSGTLRQSVPIPTLSWAPDWHPYTIIGDAGWADYEVRTRLKVSGNDAAAVMGRVHHVGTGYGFEPKGYLFEVAADGAFRLVSVNGKLDKAALIGDAEQQAIIRAAAETEPGGERVLATGFVDVVPGAWSEVSLRMVGNLVEGIVEGTVVARARDDAHSAGMAGLLAVARSDALSRPEFDWLSITEPGGRTATRYKSAAQRLYPETGGR
ncbi:hypothetical protein ACIGO6_37115 [Streptomyces sp. NPDC053750]|uniref:hypothetical protein n=1 Tax=Streptomyces sp. NPDC053750 TaxID=3365714 RepID=UPI0037D095E5